MAILHDALLYRDADLGTGFPQLSGLLAGVPDVDMRRERSHEMPWKLQGAVTYSS